MQLWQAEVLRKNLGFVAIEGAEPEVVYAPTTLSAHLRETVGSQSYFNSSMSGLTSHLFAA
jgi:hypothetical protein